MHPAKVHVQFETCICPSLLLCMKSSPWRGLICEAIASLEGPLAQVLLQQFEHEVSKVRMGFMNHLFHHPLQANQAENHTHLALTQSGTSSSYERRERISKATSAKTQLPLVTLEQGGDRHQTQDPWLSKSLSLRWLPDPGHQARSWFGFILSIFIGSQWNPTHWSYYLYYFYNRPHWGKEHHSLFNGSIIHQQVSPGKDCDLLYIWHQLGNSLCVCPCVFRSQRSILGIIPQDTINGFGHKEVHLGRLASKLQVHVCLHLPRARTTKQISPWLSYLHGFWGSYAGPNASRSAESTNSQS